MALSSLMLIKACQRITLGARVASLGYPDIIAPTDRVASILKDQLSQLTYRDDSQAICERHHMRQQQLIPDAHSFFGLLGADLDVYDIEAERGREIRCDLNYPMLTTRQYEVVLDVGTIEHCFNVAQAAENAAHLVKLGGTIFHETPFNWPNHGFYSLHPTWYADFYAANGFRVDDLRLLPRTGGALKDIPRAERFIYTEGEATIYCAALRVEEKVFVYPTQGRYRHLLEGTT